MASGAGVFSSNTSLMAGISCHVHPGVYFCIVDSYERRNEDCKRVIGTLLGTLPIVILCCIVYVLVCHALSLLMFVYIDNT